MTMIEQLQAEQAHQMALRMRDNVQLTGDAVEITGSRVVVKKVSVSAERMLVRGSAQSARQSELSVEADEEINNSYANASGNREEARCFGQPEKEQPIKIRRIARLQRKNRHREPSPDRFAVNNDLVAMRIKAPTSTSLG
jgi:hypothetical protein